CPSRDLPDSCSQRGISHHPFEDRAAINRDDVSSFELTFLARNAMDKFLIDADCNRSRKGWMTIALEWRYTSMFPQHFLSSRVEVGRGNTWLQKSFGRRQDGCVNSPGFPHDLQLRRALKMNLARPTHKFTFLLQSIDPA